MSAKPPIQDAVEVARRLLASDMGESGPPSRGRFIDALRQFERIEFDVAEAFDADGFLFQTGTVNWLSEPTFILGVTRQLETVDAEGEHESYLQVSLEFQYPPDPDLEAVDRVSQWWFRDSGGDFSAWLEAVESDEIWQLVASKTAREFVISADEV